MDLIGWLVVPNDVLWEKKVSMIMASMVFALGYAISWYVLFRLGIKQLGNDRVQAFARSKGYETYSELVFDFTRNTFSGAMLFFMLAIFVYFVSYQGDVQASLNCAVFKSMADSCNNMTGTLVCQKIDYSSVGFLGWNGSSINHSIQPR